MQAHTGALQQLATSTYQRNFDHIVVSIPTYMMEVMGRVSLPVSNIQRQHAFTVGEILKQKLWVGPLDQSKM